MSDTPVIDPDQIPETQGASTYYPPTTMGMLMQQRDSLLGSAESAEREAETFTALAHDNRARAAQLDEAIAAMAPAQVTLDPSE